MGSSRAPWPNGVTRPMQGRRVEGPYYLVLLKGKDNGND